MNLEKRSCRHLWSMSWSLSSLQLFTCRLFAVCFCFQRIAAADLAPGLQYFGRSIHGVMDVTDDGLVDLAVGSLGAAVILR